MLTSCAPIVLACLFLAPQKTAAQPREILPLAVWDFAEEPASTVPVPANAALVSAAPALPAGANWKRVQVPHIFRQSALPDNSAGWYRLNFILPEAARNRRIFLRLEGAASVKDVFVNGEHIGQHKGAYTAAAFDLTPAVKMGQPNRLAVRVSNRDAETTAMLARSTLYHVNGGMFRKAWLISTGAVHIFPDMGSSGVYVTPANVSTARADLGVRAVVRNALTSPAVVVARHIVTAPGGKVAARFETRATVAAGQTATLAATSPIVQPRLWDLHQPNLYTVRTELRVRGQLSDVVTERVGFRTIAFKDNRFFLNGRQVQFSGVNKHEQNEYLWNAVGDEEPRREWQWMENMGVNMVRLAHYPHSKLEYNIADEKGLAVWAENGLAGHAWTGASNEDKVVTPDGERMTREMVRQNWNHPSILFWSCGNESILAPASHYASVIRQEDSTRLVTYATEGGIPQNIDFVARNTYEGWYGGHYTGFSQMPRNAFVAETGSGEWITHHVPYGTIRWSVDKYEPAEYSELFTEYRLQTALRDDAANRPMFLWWNFREFYDRKFKQNRNTKGIVTLAGMPKDIYYLFQAFMRPNVPVVHLNGRHHFLRQFAPDNGIKAYSNAARLELVLNGVSQGTRANGEYRQPDSETRDRNNTVTPIPGKTVANVFFWKAPLKPGRNVVEVSDGQGRRDSMVIYQKNPTEPLPADPAAIVQELRSSHPGNQPVFIDRPVEAQGPVYSDVDGSADNTFDLLPRSVQGAAWIATRRLSDPAHKADLSFRINPQSQGATVFVMFSTGTYPTVTLRKPDDTIAATAANFSKTLSAAGFKNTGEKAIWRDHNVERADASLWSRTLKPGEALTLRGETLDYVVLIKKTS
ncbi:MAG TPA: glycoside hydrolase family 2 TIM barrel-domain containing protein [Abditibacteriaceae bacterium]